MDIFTVKEIAKKTFHYYDTARVLLIYTLKHKKKRNFYEFQT